MNRVLSLIIENLDKGNLDVFVKVYNDNSKVMDTFYTSLSKAFQAVELTTKYADRKWEQAVWSDGACQIHIVIEAPEELINCLRT